MQHQIKWRFLMMICFMILLVGMVPAWGAEEQTELGYTPLSELIPKGATTVIFRDEAISASMAEYYDWMQNSDGSYSLADIAKMKYFSVFSQSPIDLSEIQLFPNLTSLTIYEAPEVTGVSALSQCQRLDALSFSKVAEMNVPELVKATPQITYVSFSECGELDYKAIVGWEKLTGVDLEGSTVRDLSHLSQIPKLESLYIRNMPNADFASCQDLTRLHSVAVYENNRLQDPILWQLITRNANLERLVLGSWYIFETYDLDDTVFPNLGNLKELAIYGATIQNLGFLQNCPDLTFLVFENCSFVSREFEGLGSLKKLNELVLKNVGLTDVSFVRGMNLSLLWLEDNNITDISPFIDAEQIQKLSLLGNPVEDCAPLTQIKGLKKLFCDNSEGLPALKNVEVERLFGLWQFETSSFEEQIPQE